jgi:hypothetical protein
MVERIKCCDEEWNTEHVKRCLKCGKHLKDIEKYMDEQFSKDGTVDRSLLLD